MNLLLKIFIFLVIVPVVNATSWDFNYLTLDELMAKSSLIVVAEIKTINEALNEGRVTQDVIFTPITVLKGNPDPTGFKYYANFESKGMFPGVGHYISSPPGTKYLLFLTEQDGHYVSVRGICGALEVNEYLHDQVFWYTDDSKPQRYIDCWKEKPLNVVIARIKEKADLGRGKK